jgi:hypothetical protein
MTVVEAPEVPNMRATTPALAGGLAIRVPDVEWPAGSIQRDELARWGLPRLLVVADGVEPPACTSALEDWVRPSAPEEDRERRRAAIARAWHRDGPAGVPRLSPTGELRWRGRAVALPPDWWPVARRLVGAPNRVISMDALCGAHTGGPRALRARLVELSVAVAPLGLRVRFVPPAGVILEPLAIPACSCEPIDDPGRGDPA